MLLLTAGLDLTTGVFALLIVCVLAVCFFEFVNGFHDTANAVATVIYTKSMRPTYAVVLSGFMNFLGVILGGLGVAMGILKLLPLTDLMYAPLGENVAFLLGVLIAAITWNLGTWYFGIPASSSHTLIGALIGASLVFGNVSSEQWTKAYEILIFLLITPLAGFFFAWILLVLMRKVVKNKDLFESPLDEDVPPTWIRLLMVFGCVGVSYSHGSNDGQKGVGLLMVVLIAFLPAYFALVPDFNAQKCNDELSKIEQILVAAPAGNALSADVTHLQTQITNTKTLLAQLPSAEATGGEVLKKTKVDIRRQIRNVIPHELKDLTKKEQAATLWTKEQIADLKKAASDKGLLTFTDFAPNWTVILISICLGIGTMIGWKRIVQTIGEKIGKSAFDYSQGFVSQFVSAGTIFASTWFKLPVSTTHIVSSSVMGTMFGKGGKGNIQRKTIFNIFMAWVLTLPVSIGLSAGIYWLLRFVLV